jgi:two-component sensor histidine kinase
LVELLAAFRSIASRVMGLAQVFDHLLGVGMSRVINFGDYVEALCENLPELYSADDIVTKCSVEPVRIELDEATALGVIITELVSNAYVYAFPDTVGEITVTLRVGVGAGTLRVVDDGIGFVEVETKRRGVGLVRRLVEQVGGILTLRSEGGSSWTIEFPVREISEPGVDPAR